MILYVDQSKIILRMDSKMQTTDSSIIFEGITSLSALIAAQRGGKSRRVRSERNAVGFNLLDTLQKNSDLNL